MLKILQKDIIILFFFLSANICLSASEDRVDDAKETLDSLINEFGNSYIAGSKEELLIICDSINARSLEIDQAYYSLITDLYYGIYYISKAEYEKAYAYLVKAENFYKENKDELTTVLALSRICLLYNNLAVYNIEHSLDYQLGLDYLLTSLKIAKENALHVDYANITYSLIYLNLLREDSSSLEFAEDIYNQGMEWEDESVKFLGSLSLAMMYYIDAQYEVALSHIEKAISSPSMRADKKNIMNIIYANILSALGRNVKAEETYLSAQEGLEDELTSISTYILLSYGKFLISTNQLDKALSALNTATDYAILGNKSLLFQVYEELSKVYDKKGDNIKSLEFYRKYHNEYIDIFNIQNERALKSLSLKHQAEIHEAQIQKFEIKEVHKNRLLLISFFIIFIFIGFTAFLIIIYRNKNRLYLKIVQQYKATIDKEESLSKSADIDSDGNELLFKSLEDLMKKEKIFKDFNLDRERLSRLLGTNRTYLAQIIKKKTSKSITQYINSYRIEEALRILSNVSDDSPLKSVCMDCGFSTKTTFYNQFQNQVGMTPAKYREQILIISKTENNFE